MKKREEDDGLEWTQPELSKPEPKEKKPSGVEQVLAAGGVVIAMDVASAIASNMR